MRRIVLALCWLLVCCGAPKLPSKMAKDISEGRIAAGFLLRNKQIFYSEEVYKVMWIESRAQEATFEGIYDIDAQLSRVFVGQLRSLGLNAIGLNEALESEDDRNALHQVVLSQDRPPGEPWTPLSLNESQRRALHAAGVRHVLLWCGQQYNIQKYSMSPRAIISLPANLFILDVAEGAQIHDQNIPLSVFYKPQRTVREIEAHRLAKLRSLTVDASIEATQRHIAKLLRLK